MTRKNSQSAPNQGNRWMVSYMDVLSILLIFFMVAAAKSLDVPSAQAMNTAKTPAVQKEADPPAEKVEVDPVAETVQASAPVEAAASGPVEVEHPRADLVRAQELLEAQGLEPKLESRGLVISVPQVILFSSGEDTVNPKALPTLAQIAGVLREIPNDVRLVGYADTVPVHNRRFRSNWDLSMARSEKILELLSNRYAIAESRLSIASYGPWRPAAPNDTVDGRAFNRRVEIVILDETNPAAAQVEPISWP